MDNQNPIIKVGDFVQGSNFLIWKITNIEVGDNFYTIQGFNLDGSGGSLTFTTRIENNCIQMELIAKDKKSGLLTNVNSLYFISQQNNPWFYLLNTDEDKFSRRRIRTKGLRPQIDVSNDIDKLLEIRPGDHFKFLKFHFKFYDFVDLDLLDEKNYYSTMSSTEVCGWKIGQNFYHEALSRCRYLIVITFMPDNYHEESFAGMILSGPVLDSGMEDTIYYYLLCAKTFTSDDCKTRRESSDNITDEINNEINNEEINPSFGVLLQCIMGTFLNKYGYKNIQLDALESSYQYYERWGYKLCCVSNCVKDPLYKMRFDNYSTEEFCSYSIEKLKLLKQFDSRHNKYLNIA